MLNHFIFCVVSSFYKLEGCLALLLNIDTCNGKVIAHWFWLASFSSNEGNGHFLYFLICFFWFSHLILLLVCIGRCFISSEMLANISGNAAIFIRHASFVEQLATSMALANSRVNLINRASTTKRPKTNVVSDCSTETMSDWDWIIKCYGLCPTFYAMAVCITCM